MRSEIDQLAVEILRFLAETGVQINQQQIILRQMPGLSSIASFVESRNYGKDVYLCICLEADTADRRTMTWWMDIRPRDNDWLINASVLWNGRTTVVELPPKSVPDFRSVEKQVPLILSKILVVGTRAITSQGADRQ